MIERKKGEEERERDEGGKEKREEGKEKGKRKKSENEVSGRRIKTGFGNFLTQYLTSSQHLAQFSESYNNKTH